MSTNLMRDEDFKRKSRLSVLYFAIEHNGT